MPNSVTPRTHCIKNATKEAHSLPWRLARLCNPLKWVRKHKSAKVQSVVGQEKWKRKNKEQLMGQGGLRPGDGKRWTGTTALNRQRKCLHATFSYSGEESTVSPRRVKKGEGEEMGGVVKCNKHTNAPRSINHTKPSSRPPLTRTLNASRSRGKINFAIKLQEKTKRTKRSTLYRLFDIQYCQQKKKKQIVCM